MLAPEVVATVLGNGADGSDNRFHAATGWKFRRDTVHLLLEDTAPHPAHIANNDPRWVVFVFVRVRVAHSRHAPLAPGPACADANWSKF